MIEIKKDSLLKESPDYEDYSENIVKETTKKCNCKCKSGGCCKKS